jgi:hypothetical protein
MRWIASHVWMAVALAGLLQTATYGQESEISSLRAEVDTLRREMGASATASYDDKQAAPVPATAGASGGDCCGGCASGCASGCGCNTCCGGCCNDCCGCCADTRGTCGCFEPCCHCPGFWGMAELMWFKYHRADGVRTGTDEAGDDAEFDLEITPRITVGYVGQDGLGFRIRYWDFEHDALDNDNGFVNVDTYTWDFEVFDTFCLNRNWDLEIAAGIRYNEFEETLFDDEPDLRVNRFEGFGIIVGAELRRLVGANGALFARARGTILMDNKNIINVGATTNQTVELVDVVVGTTELAFGYDLIAPQCDGSYYFLRLQAEWQTWYNYSSAFEDTEDNQDFGGPADVGFAGLGVALGLAR